MGWSRKAFSTSAGPPDRPDFYERTLSPDHVDVPLVIGAAEISGTQVTVFNVGVGFHRLAPYRWTFGGNEGDFANVRRAEFMVIVIENHHRKQTVEPADRITRSIEIESESRMNLAAAVTLADNQAEAFLEIPLVLLPATKRRCRIRNPDRRKIEVLRCGNAREHFKNKRHRPEHRDAFAADRFRCL